jgi:hypothetical protein
MIGFKGSHFERDVILWAELAKDPLGVGGESMQTRRVHYDSTKSNAAEAALGPRYSGFCRKNRDASAEAIVQ